MQFECMSNDKYSGGVNDDPETPAGPAGGGDAVGPADAPERIARALAALRRGGRPPWATRDDDRPERGRGHRHGHPHGGPHAHGPGPSGHRGPHGEPGAGPWAFRFGPVARHRLLATLDAADRAMSVTELAEAIGVDQPRASRLVQGAVADGLVAREADPDDARRTRVRLTESGRAAVRSAGAEHRRAIESALDGFSDEERVVFADLLTRFAEGLRRERGR
ncbi:hypothetical protein GCM10022282_03080 [Agromyces indicus]